MFDGVMPKRRMDAFWKETYSSHSPVWSVLNTDGCYN
jgi:hypothetical protein